MTTTDIITAALSTLLALVAAVARGALDVLFAVADAFEGTP